MTHDGSMGLRNITPQIEEWLDKIGVASPQEFEAIGAHKLYSQLLDAGHAPDDELRARLIGAEQDIDWHIIAERDADRSKSRFVDIDEA